MKFKKIDYIPQRLFLELFMGFSMVIFLILVLAAKAFEKWSQFKEKSRA